MCGIAGFHSVPKDKRFDLVCYLGWLIDKRGGDAAGYVAVGQTTRVGHKLGEWQGANKRFLDRAAAGHVCMMHARYTTHGHKGIQNAHPFTIRREGRSVLHGCHNGMLYGTEQSAKKYGREWSVDSREFFELLADGKVEDIKELDGYGVVTWVPAGSDKVNILKLTRWADAEVALLEEGGIVWASTKEILAAAIGAAELHIKETYTLEHGVVYAIADGQIVSTPVKGITVDNRDYSWASGRGGGWYGCVDYDECGVSQRTLRDVYATSTKPSRYRSLLERSLAMNACKIRVGVCNDDGFFDTDDEGYEYCCNVCKRFYFCACDLIPCIVCGEKLTVGDRADCEEPMCKPCYRSWHVSDKPEDVQRYIRVAEEEDNAKEAVVTDQEWAKAAEKAKVG